MTICIQLLLFAKGIKKKRSSNPNSLPSAPVQLSWDSLETYHWITNPLNTNSSRVWAGIRLLRPDSHGRPLN